MVKAAFVMALASLLTLAPRWAAAFSLEPTEIEFASWPAYCQARYVTTNEGTQSSFAALVPPSVEPNVIGQIGEQTYRHVHHYCAGLIHLARARLAKDPDRKRFELGEARREVVYSVRRDTSASPLYSTMIFNLALIERELGDVETAKRYLEESIAANPEDAKSYIGLAIILRGTSDLEPARMILEQGLKATEGQSVDIHYNLGLVCFELGDIACATKHAESAYAVGYPLAGLREKLKARGAWTQ